jgi:hypothetical protein
MNRKKEVNNVQSSLDFTRSSIQEGLNTEA